MQWLAETAFCAKAHQEKSVIFHGMNTLHAKHAESGIHRTLQLFCSKYINIISLALLVLMGTP